MFFSFFFCSFNFAFFVRKFISPAQSKSLCMTMAIEPPTLCPASRRRHGQSIETSTHRETSTTWTEAFLVELLQTSYPRLANYKTFAAVCLFLKSDKNWLKTKPAKTTWYVARTIASKKKKKGGVVLVRKYLWQVRLCVLCVQVCWAQGPGQATTAQTAGVGQATHAESWGKRARVVDQWQGMYDTLFVVVN